MTGRREFLGKLIGSLGGASSEKWIQTEKITPTSAVESKEWALIIQLNDQCFDPSDEDLARASKKIKEAMGIDKVLILPSGMQAKVVMPGGVSQSESVGGYYSYEIHAKTEQDLLNRLKLVHGEK